MIKPSLPKGTRDFSPEVVRKRNYILTVIRTVFEKYGFQPLETPAMEKLSTLTGKYGEEGDKLMFRVLNNGDIYSKASGAKNSKELAALVSKRALRYDLTIPFARYVVMHRNDIVFPFKRYQIQPVWRADRPQRGRYREFYQCDADVVGSTSLLNEIDFLAIYDTALSQLGLRGYEIHINNRKVLAGLAQVIGKEEQLTEITIAIDKLDKVGIDGVRNELQDRRLSEKEIQFIEKFLKISGTNEEKIEQLGELLNRAAVAQTGIAELKTVLKSDYYAYQEPPVFNPTLARGLNYYTGSIMEVKAPKAVKMGSIGGGGRYDNLTGLFGMEGLSGVGISFGVDRIYDIMESLQLFPKVVDQSTKVLFLQIEQDSLSLIFSLLNRLRLEGIPAEIYPDKSKFNKQMKYANKRNIPYVAVIGENELASGTVSIKDMQSGEQKAIVKEDVVNYFLEKN